MRRLISLVLFNVVIQTGTNAQEITPPVSPIVCIGCYKIEIFGKTKVDRPNTLTVLAEIAGRRHDDFDSTAARISKLCLSAVERWKSL